MFTKVFTPKTLKLFSLTRTHTGIKKTKKTENIYKIKNQNTYTTSNRVGLICAQCMRITSSIYL